jgi:hypothetical protein
MIDITTEQLQEEMILHTGNPDRVLEDALWVRGFIDGVNWTIKLIHKEENKTHGKNSRT